VGGECGTFGLREKYIYTRYWLDTLEKKTALKTWRGWEDNIKMDLNEEEWERVGCIRVAEDRNNCWAVVNTVMNLQDL
jgi:hypothetical protein